MSQKISVIIATHNAATTLEQAITSVVNQSYPNKELIIIDGGSSDNTLNIIKQYSSSISYYVSEKDKGIYDALNKGIDAATGEWLYFLGADDMLMNEDVFGKVFNEEKSAHPDFIYGNTRLRSNNKIIGGARTYHELIRRNISHQAVFYNKNIFTSIGRYDTKYKILADYDLNLKVFKDEKIKKKYIDMDICLFNDKGGASNITIDSSFFKDKLAYFRNIERFSSAHPALQQYNFYYGIVQLIRDKKTAGFRYCIRSFISGDRKVFYILVFIKFLLGAMGLLKKIKFV